MRSYYLLAVMSCHLQDNEQNTRKFHRYSVTRANLLPNDNKFFGSINVMRLPNCQYKYEIYAPSGIDYMLVLKKLRQMANYAFFMTKNIMRSNR